MQSRISQAWHYKIVSVWSVALIYMAFCFVFYSSSMSFFYFFLQLCEHKLKPTVIMGTTTPLTVGPPGSQCVTRCLFAVYTFQGNLFGASLIGSLTFCICVIMKPQMGQLPSSNDIFRNQQFYRNSSVWAAWWRVMKGSCLSFFFLGFPFLSLHYRVSVVASDLKVVQPKHNRHLLNWYLMSCVKLTWKQQPNSGGKLMCGKLRSFLGAALWFVGCEVQKEVFFFWTWISLNEPLPVNILRLVGEQAL